MPAAAAFEAVVLPQLDAAYNLARWLTHDPVLAQDIVQDAVLRALAYFATYRGGDPRAWFLAIVRNAAYATLRATPAASTIDTHAEQHPDPAPDPEATLARNQNLAHLQHAIAALPLELRECLVLRELEGLSYKEIAVVTAVPIGTVMSRLWRARQTLLPHGVAP